MHSSGLSVEKEKSIKSTCGQMEKESLVPLPLSLPPPPPPQICGTIVKQKPAKRSSGVRASLMPYLGAKL